MNRRTSYRLNEAPSDTVALGQHQDLALAAVLLTSSVAAPLAAVGLVWRDGLGPTAQVALGLSVAVWALWPLYHSRFRRWVAYALILTLWLGSFTAIVTQGSVRSVGSTVMLAALVLAGSFLSRAATVATALLSLVALAILNHLEQTGAMPSRLAAVGWAVWILQAACIVTALVSVLFSRFRLLAAFRDQREAYELAVDAEKDMRASQERFLSLFQNNPAATLVLSLDTRRIVNANDAFEQLLGYPGRQMTGQEPPVFWVDPSEHLAFRSALKAHDRVANLRARLRRQDGTEIDALVFANVVRQERERLLMIMALDVSAEERSRQALQRSEERFSKAFNFSPLGMVITRLSDGLFIEANPANERVIGWTPEDLKGRTSQQVGVWLSEVERSDYVQGLRRDGRLQGYETRMRSKRGEVVPVRLWAETIDIAGEPCALTFTLNVAEEKRRQDILINLARGISSKTGEAFFLSLAEHLASATGAGSVVVAELMAPGQAHTLALVNKQQLQANLPLALAQTAYGRLLESDGLVLVHPDDQHLPRSTPPFDPDDVGTLAGMALRDADGSVIGLLAAVWRERQDPGEEVRALLQVFASRCNAEMLRLRRDREILRLQATLEQRVHERTEQLRYLNQELESFSYSVSHDLKSPLRSIDGFIHLLREQLAGRATAEDEDMIGRVQESVARMNGLINDLLALARVSRGQLQRTRVNLSELVHDVVRRERDRDPTRDVEVVIEPDLYADCDPRMAQIVLENLIGNAWKYSRHTAHARVEFDRSDANDGGDPGGFCITDNGAGFDMSRSDRLFKPFSRLHNGTEFEGSGIGLATVRRIIERHGGQISAAGAPGQGARFCFTFGNRQA
ncbi:MAG: PAS domain S-box protein [Burkholderiales bacterium]|nr:MAG: PAS domain S-box protein [Burkholderiales bacterium]